METSSAISNCSCLKEHPKIYKEWFNIADSDGDGRVYGNDATKFFAMSKLSRQELKQVWAVADSKRKGFLGLAVCDDTHILMYHTPLHVSAANGNVEIAKYLLAWTGSDKVDLEAMNTYGETPLHMAAKNGCNEAAKLLLRMVFLSKLKPATV